MVDKLTGLVAIFQRPEFDFKNNKAGGDDILGDAYEYLMRNFATESGKSKGQFYTVFLQKWWELTKSCLRTEITQFMILLAVPDPY